MTSMTNADEFLDYVRQRAHYGSTYEPNIYSTRTYNTTLNLKDLDVVEIDEEEEEIKQAISSTHIFDPEDLFL